MHLHLGIEDGRGKREKSKSQRYSAHKAKKHKTLAFLNIYTEFLRA